jgi:hypothetical protein
MIDARSFLGILAALAVPLAVAPARAVTYVTAITDANEVAATLTNYGVLGNNFVDRTPSLEYPQGTGYEHMVYGGLWIGAHATDGQGAFTGVTTGVLDPFAGAATAAYSEFTPAGDGLVKRSAVVSSPVYDPSALATLEYIALFDDLTPKTANGNPEVHRPLRVQVRQISQQWNLPGWEHFAVERFVIRNTGPNALTDVHVGIYSELASGPKNAYSTWPPTSFGSIYGSWYRKALLAYDAGPRLLREHRCSGPPIPSGCQFEITPAWIGIQLLTPPAVGQQVTVGAWEWGFNPARDQDVERYALLSSGTIANFAAPEFQPGTADPVELFALGPFPVIAPGDSVEVAFALVGGAEEADILAHAASAQAAHDAGYMHPVVGVDPRDPTRTVALAVAPGRNPVSRSASGFTVDLPASTERAALDVLDVTGRRIARRDLAGLGPGRHRVRIDELAAVAPGVYYLRLADGRDVAESRIVLLP